jgi:thioredoxin-like negative regulator of GroEL
MANRFNVNVRVPVSEDPDAQAIEAKHVKEITQGDWEKDVVGEALPVLVHFYSKTSPASEALSPRFGALAEKFSGKARFVKIQHPASSELAGRLGVTESPTVVFLQGGKENGARLTGGEIKRTELKARVEAMLGVVPAAAPAR